MSTPIVLRFKAETASATKAMVDLASSATSAMGGVSAAALAAHQSTGSSLGGMALNAAKVVAGLSVLQYAAIGAFAAFGAAAAAGAAELEEFTAIADKAAKSNVGTDFFQVFTQNARDFGLTVKEIEADLARLERSTRTRFDGDAASGSINTARQALGERFLGTNDYGRSSAPQIFDNARNAEERIRAVLVALRDLESAGQQLAAIDLARRLGLDGLAEKVETGRTSFTAFNTEVDRGGALISSELIQKAEDLKRRFEANARELSENLRPILDECARLAVSIGNGAAWTAEQFTALIGVVGRVVKAFRDAKVEADALSGSAARVSAIAPGGPADPNDPAAQAQAARDAAGRRFQRGTVQQVNRINEAAAAEGDREAARARGLGGLEARVSPTGFSAPTPFARPGNAPAARASSPAAAETDEWAKSYERLIEQMERTKGQLAAERDGIGKNTIEREKLVAVARAEADANKAGGELTDAQRAKVLSLAEAQGRLRVSIEEATNAQRAFGDAMQYAGDRIVDMAFNGRKVQDVLKGLTVELARAALTGQGTFARLLGTAPAAGSPQGSVGGLLGLLGGGGGGGNFGGGGAFSFGAGGYSGAGPFMPAAGGGGLFGGMLIPGILHDGGTVGVHGYGHGRMVPASLFAGAPRHHSGAMIGSDERPAILQVGEDVLNAAQKGQLARTMSTLGAMAQGGTTVTFAPQTTIDARGSQMSEGQISALLDARDRRLHQQIDQNLPTMISNARRDRRLP